MSWFERLQGRVAALAGAPGVTVETRALIGAGEPLSADARRAVREDGGFVLDAGMRAFYDTVERVDVVWFHDALGGAGHVGGRFDIGALDAVMLSGYGEADLAGMAPRDATERAFLLEMRHLDTHHCAADQWLALRPAPDDSPTFWWRAPAGSGLDIPLRGRFDELMDLMVRACGATGWPLLAANLSSLRSAHRQRLLFQPDSQAERLRERLVLLSSLPGLKADAIPLLEQLDSMVESSPEATLI